MQEGSKREDATLLAYSLITEEREKGTFKRTSGDLGAWAPWSRRIANCKSLLTAFLVLVPPPQKRSL